MAISGAQPAYMTARSGYLRSGAGRSGDYNGSWIVRVNSADQTLVHNIIAGLIHVTLAKAGEPSTASFQIANTTPAEGQRVTIAHGAEDNLVFGGNIIRLSQQSVAGYTRPIWDVECVDLSFKANEYRVFREYPAFDELNVNWYPAAIIADILETFSPSGNWTTNHLGYFPSDVFLQIAFDGETVREAIQKVAAAFHGESFFDPTGDVWAYQTHPWSPVQVDTTTTPQYAYGRLTYERTIQQATTRALVKGKRTTTVIDFDNSLSLDTQLPLADFSPFLSPYFAALAGGASYALPKPVDVWIRGKRIIMATAIFAGSMGPTTTSDTAIGATTIDVDSLAFFTTGQTPQWLTDGNQYLFFGGTGAGPTLTTIPASGTGSVTAKIPSGTTLTPVPVLRFITQPLPEGVIPRGTEVALAIEVVNGAAETVFGGLLTDGTHPSQGIFQTYINDDSLLTDAATAEAIAATSNFSQVGVAGQFAELPVLIGSPGQQLFVRITPRGINVTAKILSVTLGTRGNAGGGHPVSQVSFSTRTELRAINVLAGTPTALDIR